MRTKQLFTHQEAKHFLKRKQMQSNSETKIEKTFVRLNNIMQSTVNICLVTGHCRMSIPGKIINEHKCIWHILMLSKAPVSNQFKKKKFFLPETNTILWLCSWITSAKCPDANCYIFISQCVLLFCHAPSMSCDAQLYSFPLPNICWTFWLNLCSFFLKHGGE